MTTTPQQGLMPIGRLADRTGLSLKALRLYDELGLLPPAHVDPASGYRYYDDEQLGTARLIGLLRQVGMPLADIGALLADRDPARLRAWWRGVAEGHRDREGVVRYLLTTLDDGERPAFEVATRWVPEVTVVCASGHVLQPDLPRFIPDRLRLLRDHVAAHRESHGAVAHETDWTTYHSTSMSDSAGLVEVCVPLDGTVPPTTEITVRVEPGHHEAYARLTKAQVRPPHVMHAFDAVAEWLAARGLARTLDPREVYFADWVAVDDGTPAVDVAFPYRGEGAGDDDAEEARP